MILRSFILSIIVFFSHMLLNGAASSLIYDNGGYYTFGYGIVYGLFVGFWAYWLLSYIYVRITKNDVFNKYKYLKASATIFIGYLLYRIPDMIDRDFFTDFKWWFFVIFLFLIPLLVEFEKLLRKPKKI